VQDSWARAGEMRRSRKRRRAHAGKNQVVINNGCSSGSIVILMYPV